MPQDTVYPDNPHALYEQHGYSPAVKANGLLFVSGQVGARPDGSPEPQLEDEVKLAFSNLKEVLEAAGCSFADVVDLTIFMIDPEPKMELALAALREAWPAKPYPAVTAVGVTWLAGFRFELKVVATLPSAHDGGVC